MDNNRKDEKPITQCPVAVHTATIAPWCSWPSIEGSGPLDPDSNSGGATIFH